MANYNKNVEVCTLFEKQLKIKKFKLLKNIFSLFLIILIYANLKKIIMQTQFRSKTSSVLKQI